MKRIEIEMPDEEAQQLQHLALQRGQSLEETARDVLLHGIRQLDDTTLGGVDVASDFSRLSVRLEPISTTTYRLSVLKDGHQLCSDAMAMVGCARSSEGDISARHDDYFVSALEE